LKDAPPATILELTSRLVADLSIPVYVNDRVDIALAAGAHGVHVGADDIAPAAVRDLAPHPFRIGVSVGCDAEALAVREAPVDYWSIGSIYATGSKPDAGQPIGIGGFQSLAQQAPAGMPVIAIGGIDSTNAREILEAGAAGIAVISAIFGAADMERSARELRKIMDELGTAHRP
jgi:thiamine-phosphate pyrophosphorylase